MQFQWDDLNDHEGNLYHILSSHPEMRSSRFIELVFDTPSGDEDIYDSIRGKETYLVVEKTYRRKLYKIVFQKVGIAIRIKTGHRINRRRS